MKPHPHTSPSDIFQCEKVGSAIRSLLESFDHRCSLAGSDEVVA